MNISHLGEFDFIRRFAGRFQQLLPENMHGIGDDCAIYPINDREDLVLSTDLLIEGVHFLRDRISPYDLGHKALAVNLSDIAAMGCQPTGSLLSIGLPADLPVAEADAIMQGYYDLSKAFQVPLLGGDTTRSEKQLVINVAIMGHCPRGQARLRSMAQPGDLLCVTGPLGDSAAGLHALLQELPANDLVDTLINKHHRPIPRIQQGQWLAQQPPVHAMMDISDGIASDCLHILTASNLQAQIRLDALPLSDHLLAAARRYGWDAQQLAAAGGEDYELLFTVAPGDFKKLNNAYTAHFHQPIQSIGQLQHGSPVIHWYNKSHHVQSPKHPFKHF